VRIQNVILDKADILHKAVDRGSREGCVTSSVQVLMMPARYTTRSTAGGLMAIWSQSSTLVPNDINIVSQIQSKQFFHYSHPTVSDNLCRQSSGNNLLSILKLMKQNSKS
jgi:hypothetical protein